MSAFNRAPAATDPNTWRNNNDHRQPPPTGPSQLQPPTGPRDRSMPFQQPSSIARPAVPVPGPSAPSVAATSHPIPEPLNPIPTFTHVPYLTSIQLETLYACRRGARMSASTWLTNRDIATGFIQSVASRLGFPQRTIATAQQIYQRFHLFYPPSDFVFHEIAVASLFVAAKLCDTHKKPRDLLLASYALRFPQLVKGGGPSSSSSSSALPPDTELSAEEPSFPTLTGQKRKHPSTAVEGTTTSPRPLAMAIGSVSESDIDPNILETDRKRLMALEKLILESLCFNFHSNANAALKMVIKLGRRCGLGKSFIRSAWKVGADMFRGSGPMQYPPNVVAVAALYACALLARPPPRTVPGHQDDVPGKQGEEGVEGDAITKFLERIKSVSTTPAPTPNTTAISSETSNKIPLSEPFPNCDPEIRVHVEDVEEAVHELLDLYLSYASSLPPSLYMTSASGLGPAHGHSGTPSPLSPADPLDAYAPSPSSTGSDNHQTTGGAGRERKKLKQYEYSPPPFGLVDWLNCSRCLQLQLSTSTSTSGSGNKGNKPNTSSAQGGDPTVPTKELTTLLTDLKIYLRGLEYDRQKADDEFLADLDVIAEVDIVPSLSAGSDLSMLVGATGGSVAHSVEILLKPLNPDNITLGSTASSNANANAAVDITSNLDKSKKEIVERIKRRKLVASLRLIFVEPEVEKSAHTVRLHLQEKEKIVAQTSTTTTTPATAAAGVGGIAETSLPQSNVKKNRIDSAKRFLF